MQGTVIFQTHVYRIVINHKWHGAPEMDASCYAHSPSPGAAPGLSPLLIPSNRSGGLLKALIQAGRRTWKGNEPLVPRHDCILQAQLYRVNGKLPSYIVHQCLCQEIPLRVPIPTECTCLLLIGIDSPGPIMPVWHPVCAACARRSYRKGHIRTNSCISSRIQICVNFKSCKCAVFFCSQFSGDISSVPGIRDSKILRPVKH